MRKVTPKITIRELAPAELPGLWPLMHILNPDLPKARFSKRLAAMKPRGYRAAGVFLGKKMIGCSGFWIFERFWCGKHMDVDNFIIHPDHRNGGIGQKLVDWLEQKALEEKVELMVLDAYTHNFLSHRFYYRAGFVVSGYHFTKVPGTEAPYLAASLRKK